jgi:copper transport protein
MLIRLVAAWLFLALGCVAASAHATLIRSEPADGAILDESPRRLVLTFNEPVSPLVLRLVAADGTATPLEGATLADQTLTVELPALADGGYVASWRVVSSDGHPIGGSVVFSVGAGGAPAIRPADDAPDRPLEAAIVIVRTLVYAGLFVGVGGMFFAAFIAAPPKAAMRTTVAALAMTPVALFIAIGLQGLDALGLKIGDIVEAPPWRAGFETSYGAAALIAVFAAVTALVGLGAQPRAKKALAALGLAALGLAFAATGHASAAAPQWLTRPAVFFHTTGVAVWAGALPPLAFLLLGRDQGDGAAALARFSRVIPYAVAPLAAAGIVLAVIQVGTFEALIDTAYGLVLLAKGLLLAVLFGLAAANRLWLTAPALAGDSIATRRLAASVAAEVVLVAAILAVVALWRFTPPPRALAAAIEPPAIVHIHNDKGMAMVTITPGRAGPVSVSVALAAHDGAPLTAREVTLTLALPAAGIEPIRRSMTMTEGTWTADDVMLPIPGAWTVKAAALITDFDLVTVEGIAEIGK